MQAIITVGAAGSGKSTWARSLSALYPGKYVIIERDIIRAANGIGPIGDAQQERFVTKVQNGQIEAALLDGMIPIVANTNTNKGIRNALIRQLHKFGADVMVTVFHPPLDTVLEQNAQRGDAAVPEHVVRKMWQSLDSQVSSIQGYYQRPTFNGYKHSEGRQDVVVVDIDGTVADSVGIRSPYDYTKVSLDRPRKDVIKIVQALSEQYQIIFVSGRKDECEDDTIAWLDEHVGIDYALYMRKTEDERADFIIKSEIYDERIIPYYNIVAVLDDRDSVVTHLRLRGINVLQVQPGRF